MVSVLGLLVPFGLTTAFLFGAEMKTKTPVHLGLLWCLMFAGFLWSALSYRSLAVDDDGLLVVKGLPPFRRSRVIRFSSIRRIYIRDHFNKLVVELDNGSREVIASSYSALELPLLQARDEMYEARSPRRNLGAVKSFLDRKLQQQGTSATN